jgi:hypothetical protein
LYRIAIQSENALLSSGRRQSFSDRWAELLREAGHEVRFVEATKPDFFEQVRGCDGFMWWYAHLPFPRHFARRVTAAVEHGMGIPVFPSWKTTWHFDDKIGHYYLLRAAGIPTADTRIFWFRREAIDYCRDATYPMVVKLAGGITSENVKLLRSFEEAEYWINRMFSSGLVSLQRPALGGLKGAKRRLKDSLRLLVRGVPPDEARRNDVHRDYFLVQEFLPDNDHDTRVTVIGNRAFAFRRFNRPDDFRASGSGRIDWDHTKVDAEIVRLAFAAQRKLQSQSLAVDGLYRNGERVIVEISYYYEGWALAQCPGHWELRGAPDAGRLEWVEGSVRPEDAILQDFLALLDRRSRGADAANGDRTGAEADAAATGHALSLAGAVRF